MAGARCGYWRGERGWPVTLACLVVESLCVDVPERHPAGPVPVLRIACSRADLDQVPGDAAEEIAQRCQNVQRQPSGWPAAIVARATGW